jgi:2-(3-amino-3-carboxypropyl)histidine synthase
MKSTLCVFLFLSSIVLHRRFHLEAAMIANPHLPAYKYDPYSKKFTTEEYDHARMMSARRKAVDAVKMKPGSTIGIIMGTLGRQGNPRVVTMLEVSADLLRRILFSRSV